METIRGWKLFRLMKNGSIRSLFINKTRDLQTGIWMESESHPTKGFAVRPGWHCCLEPRAPHLKTEGRVWREVEMQGITEFSRPECQGGTWILADRIRIIQNENDQMELL